MVGHYHAVVSVSSLDTYITAAEAALLIGDYATALTNALAAKAAMMRLPDTQHGAASMRWDRRAIDSLVMDIRREQAAAAQFAGPKSTLINYVNPTT